MNEIEDIELGIQKMSLDSKELYPDYTERHRFEARLHEFLEVDISSEIMDFSNGVLNYLTESVIPTKQDSRLPLLLLFGNPAPSSVRNKCFFADVKGKREHPFWSVLEKAGIITFKKARKDINTFRTRSLFSLNYESPFRIGLAVFYSIPSPATDPKWSGVAGLRKLFGARVFREVTLCEKKRVENLIQGFVGSNPRGSIIAFQKDAYLGVKDDKSQESLVVRDGEWSAVETRSSFSSVKLFRMPITRFMAARWYVKFFRQVVRLASRAGLEPTT